MLTLFLVHAVSDINALVAMILRLQYRPPLLLVISPHTSQLNGGGGFCGPGLGTPPSQRGYDNCSLFPRLHGPQPPGAEDHPEIDRVLLYAFCLVWQEQKEEWSSTWKSNVLGWIQPAFLLVRKWGWESDLIPWKVYTGNHGICMDKIKGAWGGEW